MVGRPVVIRLSPLPGTTATIATTAATAASTTTDTINNTNLSMAYVEYEFFGERFASAPVNYDKNMFDDQDDDAKSPTRSPNLDYEFVHHVDCVTQEFIDWLAKGDGAGDMSIALYVSPFVQMPKSRCSTASPEVAAAFGKEPVIDDKPQPETRKARGEGAVTAVV